MTVPLDTIVAPLAAFPGELTVTDDNRPPTPLPCDLRLRVVGDRSDRRSLRLLEEVIISSRKVCHTSTNTNTAIVTCVELELPCHDITGLDDAMVQASRIDSDRSWDGLRKLWKVSTTFRFEVMAPMVTLLGGISRTCNACNALLILRAMAQ